MKSIGKGYMSFMEGFAGPRFVDKDKQMDWKKAKEIIEEKKSDIRSVSAGLAEDWGCTSGEVWTSDKGYISQNDTYVYTSSVWATPAIEIEYNNGETETLECWEYGDNPYAYFDENY